MRTSRAMILKTAGETDTRKNRLKEILKDKSFQHGDFVLSSGEHSKVYFDVKATTLDPEGSTLAADLILDMIKGQNIQAVGGMAMGACPIVSAVCVRSATSGMPLPAFYVRKEEKSHGMKKKIEGFLPKKGDKVLILDDVATKGGSMMDAINPVRNEGCEIVRTIVVVDRQQGAGERLAAEGYELESLFKRSDLE